MITRTLINDGDPIVAPDGTVKAGAEITFQLVDTAGRQPVSLFDAAADGGEYIVGSLVTKTTNEVGLFSVDLWPNSRGEMATLYKVKLPGTTIKPFYIRVTEGEGDLTLIEAKAAQEALSPQTLSLFEALLANILEVVGTATSVATTEANGLMSFADKTYLNTLWSVHPSVANLLGASSEIIFNAKIAVLPVGGTLYWSGDMTISSQILIDKSMKLIGSGSIKIADNASAGTVATMSMLAITGSNVEVRGGLFDGNMANQSWVWSSSANYGIPVSGQHVLIADVEVKGVTGNGVGVTTGSFVEMRNVNSHHNGKKGFHSGDVSDVTIVGGFYHDNVNDSGIGAHQGMSRMRVIGASCYNNGTYGIHVGESIAGQDSGNNQIIGCTCYGNTIIDIFFARMGDTEAEIVEDSTISACHCYSTIGIELDKIKGMNVTGNTLVNSQLKIQNGYDILVTGNRISAVDKTNAIIVNGLLLSGSTLTTGNRVKLVDNDLTLTNVTEGIKVAGHANTVIRNNRFVTSGGTYDIRVYNNEDTLKIEQPGAVRARVNAQTFSTGYTNTGINGGTTVARPTAPTLYQMHFDTTLSKLIVWNGTVWKDGAGTTV